MFVIRKLTQDPEVLTPSAAKRFFAQCVSALYDRVIKRLAFRRSEWRRHFFPYWNVPGARDILKMDIPKPDLIIVYYVANFLSAKVLLEIQQHFKAPMAFYLMDAAMLTGGCHYPWDCTQYQDTCQACPIFRWPGVLDLSRKVWRERMEAFSHLNYSIIAGSRWLDDMTHRSALHQGRAISRILIGIDQDLFKPREKATAARALGADSLADSFVIYFGAQDVTDPRKGFPYLYQALKRLRSMLTDEEASRITLLTVGARSTEPLSGLDFKSVAIPYLHDRKLFPMTYNASDVFICPSVEDAGPMMINESMMSGCPVIAFRMGVAEDLVVPGETGQLLDVFDSEGLANAICLIFRLPEADRKAMGARARERALKLSTPEVQVRGIEKLVASWKG